MVLKIVMAALAHTLAAGAMTEDSATVHRVEVEAVPGVSLHTNDFLRGNNGEICLCSTGGFQGGGCL